MQKQLEAVERVARGLLAEIAGMQRLELLVMNRNEQLVRPDLSEVERLSDSLELALVDLDLARNRAGVPHP